MISAKIASIIAVATFVAGSFITSPELRAFAANTVGSSDIIDESIQSVDIKNGQVKASDIATDAVGSSEIAANTVGGSELAGVTKLLFGQCTLTNEEATSGVAIGAFITVDCTISGVDSDDSVSATLNDMQSCFELLHADAKSGFARVYILNDCDSIFAPGAGSSIAVIVFDR